MDGRLPQAEEGLQHVDLGLCHAGLGDPFAEHGAVVGPQLVIPFPLVALQVAMQRLLGLLRQLGQHLLLRAAENERPQRTAEKPQPLGVARNLFGDILENRRRAEHARIEELQQRPELAQVVLHRRAGHRQAMVGLQQPAGLRPLRVGVLDRLRFVEDGVVEAEVLELDDVPLHRAVGRDHQVVLVEVADSAPRCRPV